MGNEMVAHNRQVINRAPVLVQKVLGDSRAPVTVNTANPAVGLPVSHFQENSPL
jgi:hypothetical protein